MRVTATLIYYISWNDTEPSNEQYLKLILLFRVCYFRNKKVLCGGVPKFLEELNRSYGAGVLTCEFDPQEFRAFLKWLMKNFFR